MSRWLVVALSVACAACSSSAVHDERPPLPLHIALAPLVADDVREDRKKGDDGDDTSMRFVASPEVLDQVSRRVAEALGDRAFTHVSLLPSAHGDSTPTLTPLERDVQWLSDARARQADLLVRLELSTRQVLRQRKSRVFWLNLPLFLLGGPFGWWLSDRTYFADVEIAAWFYDPRAPSLATIEGPLRTVRGEVANVARRAERMDLAFVDRAQGNVGQYALSLIWPCGFLAVEGDRLESELADRIVEQLGPGLALAALDQSPLLERGTHSFFLDFRGSTLKLDTSHHAWLRAIVLLAPSREMETMRRWSICPSGGPVTSGSFEETAEPTPGSTLRRYELQRDLGVLAAGTLVRLEIEAGEREPRVRTYTFRVPGPEDLGPAGG